MRPIGAGAGAIIGAAAASSYNNGYYGGGYAYDPGPGYYPAAPVYEDDYAYAPAPGYYSRGYNRSQRSCGQSPGSMNYTSCN